MLSSVHQCGTLTGVTATAPTVFPGLSVLDDVELVGLGLLPPAILDLPAPSTLVDAEGAPVAQVTADGAVVTLAERSTRPYEQWHLRDLDIERPAALVDEISALADLPADLRTLLVLASTDDEAAGDIALVRAARSVAEASGCILRIIPLGSRAEDRQEKIARIAAELAEGGELRDLATARRTTAGADRPASPRQGLVVLMTGLSGSGKSTLARALRNRLVEDHDLTVTLLDGDLVRRHLSAGLGFSVEDRETNVERIGWVAAEIARHGGVVIASPIAPFERTRQQVRRFVEDRGGRFVLVHVATPLQECERRDRKGLYARARAGEIPDFTGISSPYEEPDEPTLRLDTTGADVEDLLEELLAVIDLGQDQPHLEENS